MNGSGQGGWMSEPTIQARVSRTMLAASWDGHCQSNLLACEILMVN